MSKNDNETKNAITAYTDPSASGLDKFIECRPAFDLRPPTTIDFTAKVAK
jgi:hypothetical protein